MSQSFHLSGGTCTYDREKRLKKRREASARRRRQRKADRMFDRVVMIKDSGA